MSQQAPSAAPGLTLPEPATARRNLAEAFSVRSASGSVGLQLPLPASTGRHGLGPRLSLSYDPGGGNGAFGLGWSVDAGAITRRTETGLPTYDDDAEADTFLLGGRRLVPALVDDGGWVADRRDAGTHEVRAYRPRVEEEFARIERWIDKATGEAHWRSISRENITSIYGRSPEARVADPERGERVFSWLLEEVYDDKGDVVAYEYAREDRAGVAATPAEAGRAAAPRPATRYLKRVRYANRRPGVRDDWLLELVLDYGEHDPATPAPEPAPGRSWAARPDAFSSYRSGFELRTHRLCRRVLMFHRFAELGAGATLVRSMDLGYDEDPAGSRLVSIEQAGYVRDGAAYHREALPPLTFEYSPLTAGAAQSPAAAAGVPGLFVQGGASRHEWVDLDEEGLPGLLVEADGAWLYKRNLGGARLAPARPVATRPAGADLSGGRQLLMARPGDDEVGLLDTSPGARARTPRSGDGWGTQRPLGAFAGAAWSDPSVGLIDLTGDGSADLLEGLDDGFRWHPATADGFGAPRSAPGSPDPDERLPAAFARGRNEIQIADMSGDGLADLVRIRNGQVCYWPNRGRGRFGARVTMGSAPVFAPAPDYDPARVRLADVDGSGTTDLVYLGRDGITLWRNLAGNAWGAPLRVGPPPDAPDPSVVRLVDLFGDGTATAVWPSSAPGGAGAMRYLRLLPGGRPDLLVRTDNHQGGEVELHYAPSTRFARDDEAAGRPWPTRLPFCVHVVERMVTRDHVTQTELVSRFAYHHGHYDRREREFRGFGLVEQWDTDAAPADGPGGSPPPAPSYTRTWFHTGADGDAAFAAAFYAGDPLAWRLADTELPAGLAAPDARDAVRACAGRPLRQELYAQDGTDAAPHPYTVAERRCAVRVLQPAAAGHPAALMAFEREALESYYERRPADPRIAHRLALDVDELGTTTRAAQVAYPRRSPAIDEQGVLSVTVAETDVAHDLDAPDRRRVAVPVEQRTWAARGLTAPAGRPFAPAELAAAVAALAVVAPEAPEGAAPQRRLVARSRHRYYADDLSGPLPAGSVGLRALPHHSERAAFSPGQISAVFGADVPAALLSGDGHYVLDDGLWWAPSGRVVLDPARFYIAVAAVDERAAATTTEYDAYALLPVAVTDALGNRTLAANHYRLLRPWSVVDPNGNRRAVRYDAIGRVVATADMGKDGVAGGDALDLASTEPAAADDPTSRVEYRTAEWDEHRRPFAIRTLARDRHGAADARWHETRTYLDGAGQEVMTKAQAEPGPAPARGADGRLVRDAGGGLVIAAIAERWVGTGRTVYDAKGRVVRSYEPFFSSTGEFEDEADLVQWGVSPVMHYDPLGRTVRVDYPDGSYARRAFDAWRHEVHDQNDTAADSAWQAARMAPGATAPDRRAATLTAAHHDTPTVLHVDPEGRDVRTATDAGAAGKPETRVALDAAGRPVAVADARGVVVLRVRHDLLGRRLAADSADAGATRSLPDAGGRPLRSYDGRGGVARYEYDALGRTTHVWLKPAGEAERLTERVLYGEALADGAARNLLTRAYRRYDSSGVTTTEACDDKGAVLRAGRRLAKAPGGVADWSALATVVDPAAAEQAAAAALAGETFTTETTYDAFGRALSVTTPDGSVTQPSYNAAGLLEGLAIRLRGAAQATAILSSTAFNARGQRVAGTLGNGVVVQTEFDPLTFRTARLTAGGGALQDLAYTYDAVGNVVEVADGAQQSAVFSGAPATAGQRFEFDPLYRLTAAEGRELTAAGQPAADDTAWQALPGPGATTRRYRQTYGYDGVGNLQTMAHALGAATAWERRYDYDPASNRLLSTSLPQDAAAAPFAARYAHDERGNIVAMPHLARLTWDARDRLVEVDLGGGGTVHYLYDAGGQRVRKLVVRQGSLSEETIYLGGYEIFRRRSAAGLTDERHTLDVMDEGRRLAIVDAVTIENAAPAPGTPVVRYQLHDRVGSATLELDAGGQVLTYEEYLPYGGSAYAASRAGAARKRRRFGGHERDDETGLYYCGARYYAPWLGRWISADPAGLADGTNVYAYARGNPVTFSDPTGTHTRTEELPNQVLDLLSHRSSHDEGGEGRGFWASLSSALGSLWDAVAGAVSAAWDWLKGAAATAWDWLKGAAASAWDWVKGAASTAGRWAAGAAATAWQWTKQAVTSAWNWVRGAASTAWNWVKGAAASAWDWTKAAVASAWNWTKGAVGAAWNWLKGAARSVWEFTKAAAAWTWNWILAPAIRTATNFVAGAAIGFAVGGPVGAVLGGLVGAASGAIHGWAMAYAGTYDWSSGWGWAQFAIDNTWSLPNSLVGSLFASGAVIAGDEIERGAAFRGHGQLYFKHGIVAAYDTTFGNVTVGELVPRHEATHGLQARIFGPIFYPFTIANYAINLVPYWLIWHDNKKLPIDSVGRYFSRGVYPHTVIEEWAYTVEGSPQ